MAKPARFKPSWWFGIQEDVSGREQRFELLGICLDV